MGIKGIFEQTILRGGFDLAEMLERIDLYNVEAKITDEERESLYALARQHAAPQYNYDAEIEALWAAIRELQQGQQSGGTTPSEEWPEYVQPQGHTTLTTTEIKSRLMAFAMCARFRRALRAYGRPLYIPHTGRL